MPDKLAIEKKMKATADKIARQWLKSNKFRPKWITKNMPSKVSVKVSSTTQSFMYSEASQKHLLNDTASNQLVEMSPEEMFEKMKQQDAKKSPEWMYFTSKCSDLSNEVLEAVPNWELLRSEPELSAAVGNPEAPSIWIGGKGTSTTAHYDVMDNVFIQMYGRKKFRLWGPEAAKDLHVYPDVHPKARKSQIENINDILIQPREEIILEPGDSLHLPAFTFHQVEALDVSLSINVFSVCRTQMHGGRILSTPVPLIFSETLTTNTNTNNNASIMTITDASKNLLVVIEKILPIFGIDTKPSDYVTQQLLETRHRTLVGSATNRTSTKKSNEEEDEDEEEEDVKDDVATLDQNKINILSDWWNEMHKDMVASGNYTSNEMNGVRDIIVSHLLESWALQLNDGNPENVHNTLEEIARAS